MYKVKVNLTKKDEKFAKFYEDVCDKNWIEYVSKVIFLY